jgi:hypothetical protein
MDQDDNPIARLVAKFTRATTHEMTPVMGMIEECATLHEGGRKIFIIHVRNGAKTNAFWLEHLHHDPYFVTPRTGDHVKGIVNTMDDTIQFLEHSYKPIFDFQNLSNNSEREAFAWFARQAAEKKKKDEGNAPS